MNDIEEYLLKDMHERKEQANELSCQLQESLNQIKIDGIEKAKYTVQINSLWEKEGEKPVKITQNNSLDNVIRNAKIQFLKKNESRRSDEKLQAIFHVEIDLADKLYLIPSNLYQHLI